MSYFNYFRAHDQFIPRHFGFRGGGGFFGPPRGGVSITENVTIKNGPSGFWGFMTGLTQGLFGGGMGCGMGMGGSIFGGMQMMGMGMPMMGYGMSPYAMLNGAVTPQGPGQAQVGEDKHLKNLQQAYGKNYEITSHPDKKGIYQAFPKDGTKPIEGTYDELCTKLAEEKETPTVQQHQETETEEQKLAKAQKEAADKNEPKLHKDGNTWKDDAGKEYKWVGGTDGHFEEVKEDTSLDVDPGSVDGGHRTTQRSRSRGSRRTKRTDNTATVDENAYKQKAYKVSMSVQYNWSFSTCTYTATGSFTDDKGQKHDINISQQTVTVDSWSFGSGPSDRAISKDIMPKLKAKAQELGFPNLQFILPKGIANPPTATTGYYTPGDDPHDLYMAGQ